MPYIEIDSASDPRLAVFSSYTDAELRDPKQLVGLARAVDAYSPADRFCGGIFLAESRNVIDRAAASGARPFAMLVERRWEQAARAAAEPLFDRESDLPVFIGSHDLVADITGYRDTRGPMCAFFRPPGRDAAELLRASRHVAVLEDVTNYTNIGAIFRSAAALGVDAVLLTPRCHDPLYRRAARVSMGTVFQVPWARIDAWPEGGVALLRDERYRVAALALSDNAWSLRDPRLRECEKLALVLGTEGDGLAASTVAACDAVVKIPMDHGVDSLNVAAASAVAFWELFSQR